jgi:hypothetical protein
MCVTNVYTDRFPDGKEVDFRTTDYCQDGLPGRPCAILSVLENPVRNIQFGEPTTEYMMTYPERITSSKSHYSIFEHTNAEFEALQREKDLALKDCKRLEEKCHALEDLLEQSRALEESNLRETSSLRSELDTDAKESPSRHDDAIVVRDPQTQQLILGGAVQSYHDCPTCHRPFRNPSPDRNISPPHRVRSAQALLADTERELRAQIEDLLSKGTGPREMGSNSDLERENDDLRTELDRQKRVTEEMQKEAQEFLREIRDLSERNAQSYKREEQLSNTVKKLEEAQGASLTQIELRDEVERLTRELREEQLLHSIPDDEDTPEAAAARDPARKDRPENRLKRLGQTPGSIKNSSGDEGLDGKENDKDAMEDLKKIREEWEHKEQQYQESIATLQVEKEEEIQKRTIESEEVAVLTRSLQRLLNPEEDHTTQILQELSKKGAQGASLPWGSFRTDPKPRFSDPPQPPPQQPLPEKPDVARGNYFSSSSPLLTGTNAEPPQSIPDASPVRQEPTSQILTLVEALASAKRENDTQRARMEELEEMLKTERDSAQRNRISEVIAQVSQQEKHAQKRQPIHEEPIDIRSEDGEVRVGSLSKLEKGRVDPSDELGEGDYQMMFLQQIEAIAFAVIQGDLYQRLSVPARVDSFHADVIHCINSMMAHLQSISHQVSYVSRRHGKEGVLGRDEVILDVDGDWKQMVDNGNLLSNHPPRSLSIILEPTC